MQSQEKGAIQVPLSHLPLQAWQRALDYHLGETDTTCYLTGVRDRPAILACLWLALASGPELQEVNEGPSSSASPESGQSLVAVTLAKGATTGESQRIEKGPVHQRANSGPRTVHRATQCADLPASSPLAAAACCLCTLTH